MEKVIPAELYGSYYISHRLVLRLESTITVLRVGFYASSKITSSNSNSSLHDILVQRFSQYYFLYYFGSECIMLLFAQTSLKYIDTCE